MSSIWHPKNDQDSDISPFTRGNRETVTVPDPGERTSLLPRSHQEGYLSPDDPAGQVSPYNLWSVRFLRYFSINLAILTWIWWILLFVSIFVTLPGMNSRGSGFYSFSFTSLTLGLLVVVLLFFSIPSKATQLTCIFLAVMLLFDTIMTLSVYRIRVEEGWVGMTSVIWTLLMSIWTIMTDRIVSWGKQQEEERLTGRSETRRTLSEWLAVFISTIILIAVVAATFLISCTLILRSRDSSLHAPGKRYYVYDNKYQIHLFCSSNTNDKDDTQFPTVLFEAGNQAFEKSMIQIAENSIANGTISRYCYSDRPGMAWSDNAPSPFSAGISADVLSEALSSAGELGPWVLVSAGVGSIYSRIFSSRHGTDIKGTLMIDPFHEDLLYHLGSPKRGFLLWAQGVISPLGLDQIPAAIFKGRSREDRVYGSSAHQGGKFIKAKLQESLSAESKTKSEVKDAKAVQSNDIPLVLISSGIKMMENVEWKEKQREMSHLSKNLLSWDIVTGAPSEVWTTRHGREVIEKRLKELLMAL